MRFGWVQIFVSSVVVALLWPVPAMAEPVPSPHEFTDARHDEYSGRPGADFPNIDIVGATVRNAQDWMRITYRVRGTPEPGWVAIDSRRTGPGVDLTLIYYDSGGNPPSASLIRGPLRPQPHTTWCRPRAARVGPHGITALFNKSCHPRVAALLANAQVRVRVTVYTLIAEDYAPDRNFTPWIRSGG